MLIKKVLGSFPCEKNVVMNELTFFDSAASRAALDELRVGDRVGPDAVSLHSVHGLHGSREVSPIAEVSELMEQRRRGGWHIPRPNGCERVRT